MTRQSITDLYRQIQQTVADGVALTVLSIGTQQTQVLTQTQAGAQEEQSVQTFDLPIGLENLGPYTFKRFPPTPVETENAIMLVEDEIMPLAKKLPAHSRLFLIENAPTSLRAFNGDDNNFYVLEEVEQLFRRLAEVIEGSPVVSSGLPANNAFATLVLIVREFMHHLKFESITLWHNQPSAL